MAAISQRFLGRAIDWSYLFFPSFLQAASRPFSPLSFLLASFGRHQTWALSAIFWARVSLFSRCISHLNRAPIYALRKGDRRELSFGWRAQSYLLLILDVHDLSYSQAAKAGVRSTIRLLAKFVTLLLPSFLYGSLEDHPLSWYGQKVAVFEKIFLFGHTQMCGNVLKIISFLILICQCRFVGHSWKRIYQT